MIELVQLERRHADFAKRGTRVVVVSTETVDKAVLTQAQCPHLVVLADPKFDLCKAVGVVHPKAAPDGGDLAAPTTILVDRRGTVKWFFQAGKVVVRLSPDEVLAAVDEHLK